MRDKMLKAWYLFPVLFYILIAQSLRRSHGHLRFNHLVFLTVATFLFILWNSNAPKVKAALNFEKMLTLVWFLFSIFLMINNELIYSQNSAWTTLFNFFILANGAFSLLITVNQFIPINLIKAFPIHKLACLNLFAAILIVPMVSPSPIIDVWHYADIGAQLLLNGKNPYEAYYPDLYNGRYELTHGFAYWPTATYAFTLSKAIFGDVRGILVLAQFISAWGLWKIAKNLIQIPELLALIWLSFPVTFFVLEQSWVDGITLPLLTWFFIFLDGRKWIKASLLLAAMCMTKQYMIFLAVLTYFYILKNTTFKQSVIFTISTFLFTCFLAMPFLIWNASVFYSKTVTDLLVLGHREDALSWIAYLSRFYNFYIPGKVTSIIYLVTLLLCCFWVWKKAFNSLSVLFSTSTVVYFVIFLLGKQAFCNYYHMVSLILLIFSVAYYRENSPDKLYQQPSVAFQAS